MFFDDMDEQVKNHLKRSSEYCSECGEHLDDCQCDPLRFCSNCDGSGQALIDELSDRYYMGGSMYEICRECGGTGKA